MAITPFAESVRQFFARGEEIFRAAEARYPNARIDRFLARTCRGVEILAENGTLDQIVRGVRTRLQTITDKAGARWATEAPDSSGSTGPAAAQAT